MKKPAKPFDFAGRDELLHDPRLAAVYLAACIEDGDTGLFQEALRNVARAQSGGMSAVAERTALNRENLYKALSKEGKPQLDTVAKTLSALDLRFSIEPARKAKRKFVPPQRLSA